MKVKSIAFLMALAAIPAFGDPAVTSENTFGVLKVNCTTAKAIIATPWVACHSAGDIKITDLVMTSGLSNGDAILVYDTASNKFKCWAVNGSAWVPSTVVDANATVETGSPDNEAIARGQAFWFIKSGSFGESYDLYLYGQDTTNSATATVVANAYNLIASPKVQDLDLSTASLWKGMTINANDKIQVPNGASAPTTYTYKDGQGWGCNQRVPIKEGSSTYKQKWVKGGTIPAGRGFWYISKGGSGAIAW